MPQTSPIGLGVIGLGNIARQCLLACHAREVPFRLAGLCSLDPEHLARNAAEFGVEFTTTDYHELIANADVEAVAIYSHDPQHFPMIEAALTAGKDVVVTKPMVISTAEATRVLDLLEQTGRKLLVGETSRYAPHCIAAHKLVRDGDLGRLVFGETHYVHDMRPVFDKTPWRYLEPKDFPIGSMCHPISLITWYFGEVDEVSTVAVNSGVDPRYPAHTPDTYLVNLRFQNGGIGRILGAFGIIEPPLPMESLSLFGTQGSLVRNEVVFDRIPGKPVARLEFPFENDSHRREVPRYLNEFARELIEGTPTSSPARDAAHGVAVGEAIKESVRTRIPVKVTPIASAANASSTT